MSAESNIQELINKLIKRNLVFSVTEGKAKNINKDEKTCDVIREGNTDLKQVRLANILQQANTGKLVIPSADSNVICGIIENNPNDAFLISAEKFEEIIFDEGSNGGLVITPKLVDNLEKNNEILNALLGVINGNPIPEPGSGSPSALQAVLSTVLATKEVGDFSEIENNKIKH